MRTIPEVAEDIKSILNNIERTEECTGETLVDINELVDEMLAINCYKDKPKTNADRIRAMSDEELEKFIYRIHRHWDDGESIICIGNKNLHDSKEDIADWLQSEVEE